MRDAAASMQCARATVDIAQRSFATARNDRERGEAIGVATKQIRRFKRFKYDGWAEANAVIAEGVRELRAERRRIKRAGA
jgi:hypothetical protein